MTGRLIIKMIESFYFLRHFEQHWLLRFHLQAESVVERERSRQHFDAVSQTLKHALESEQVEKSAGSAADTET